MPLLCVGLSHRTAPLHLRERLTFPPEAERGRPSFEECVTLATCNRVEVYAAGRMIDFETIETYIAEATGVPRADFAPHLYRLASLEAAAHLFRVAAGLDSLILGESQILGQIARAHETSRRAGLAGATLGALFGAAIRAGRRARAETAIGRNPASAASVAARLAQHKVGPLPGKQAVIIGAGEMAELTIEALRSRGVRRLTVISRTAEKARALAERWQAEAASFDQLIPVLSQADIAITSTSAPHVILTRDRVETIMRPRPAQPLVLIDIAVPRDVAPEAGLVPNVFCYNIDELTAQFADGWSEREKEVPRVEAIVNEEAQAFAGWLQAVEVMPVIAGLRAKADAIRQAEVEKSLRHLAHLCESDRRRVELLTISLVNKLLHEPTVRLRDEAAHGRAEDYAAAVRHLFALAE